MCKRWEDEDVRKRVQQKGENYPDGNQNHRFSCASIQGATDLDEVPVNQGSRDDRHDGKYRDPHRQWTNQQIGSEPKNGRD
jgi:hypothetical protein